MASTDNVVTETANMQKIQDDVLKLWNVVKTQPEISDEQKSKIKDLYDSVVRSLKNESISSIKIIHGCVFLASLKSAATSLFDSPNHLFVRTLAAILMNVAPLSLANAFASIVLPHPGGPQRSTPFGEESRDEEEKRWG